MESGIMPPVYELGAYFLMFTIFTGGIPIAIVIGMLVINIAFQIFANAAWDNYFVSNATWDKTREYACASVGVDGWNEENLQVFIDTLDADEGLQYKALAKFVQLLGVRGLSNPCGIYTPDETGCGDCGVEDPGNRDMEWDFREGPLLYDVNAQKTTVQGWRDTYEHESWADPARKKIWSPTFGLGGRIHLNNGSYYILWDYHFPEPITITEVNYALRTTGLTASDGQFLLCSLEIDNGWLDIRVGSDGWGLHEPMTRTVTGNWANVTGIRLGHSCNYVEFGSIDGGFITCSIKAHI
jgi:hypothetical protein